MKVYTVTQKILSIGATYNITMGNPDDILMTVKGKVLTFSPKLEALKGEMLIAGMTGNYFKTNFTITDAAGTEKAKVSFPFFNFVKGFTLVTGGKTYSAKGGFFARRFSCQDESGKEVIKISKELSLRDKFQIELDESLDETVGLLSAICIDQRYFQD